MNIGQAGKKRNEGRVFRGEGEILIDTKRQLADPGFRRSSIPTCWFYEFLSMVFFMVIGVYG
jgi:hypothetical protein